VTREEAIEMIENDLKYHSKELKPEYKKALRMAIEALSAEPCREADDYENEIADLHNCLDIAEYDKERLREEVTALEEKLKALSEEPCDDTISRADTIEWLKRVTVTDGITFETGFKQILTDIQNMPSATPKQKMGRWIRSSLDTYAQGRFLPIIREVQECSACHVKYTGIRHINARFCPGCGAKMEESEDKESE
jgi:hypothetical protein